MPNKQKGFRLPEVTLTQLDWLIANGYGSQSQVVVTAIGQLYEHACAAQPPRPAPLVATSERKCHDCGATLDEYDGGRFCIGCLRANYEAYEDEAPRPAPQVQQDKEASDE